MPIHVRKARTAFLFYQSENIAKIKQELNCSMGDAMTQLSARWKALPDDEKAIYHEKERLDRERFQQDTVEADRVALRELDERRKKVSLDDTEVADGQKRGARQRLDEEREEKDRRRKQRQMELEAEIDPEILEERRRLKEQKKKETEDRQRNRAEKEKALAKQHAKLDKEQSKKATNRLEYLLKQSNIFGKLKMGKGAQSQEEQDADAIKAKERDSKKAKSNHRPAENGEEETEDLETDEENHVFLTQQPTCIKFGKLKPYQIESLNWMIHLAEKGLNGILADEMGLGKTLQSISIMAYHYEFLNIQGPHLICVPKSTLSNWMNELARWCPCLRVIKFHGSREDREYMIDNCFTAEAASHDGKRPTKPQIMNEKGELIDDNSENPRTWDVCVTTYEVCNTERKVFQRFAWKYLIIDEAHRLKNDASMFSKTVRSFRTANRLLLTGTPLQNNLHELWALLNFLLPDIFSSAEQFDEWFDLDVADENAKTQMISQLHKVLRPFMLRRLKVEVAKGLPPKTETIIMVGMSKMQKQLYKKLLLRDIDSIVGAGGSKNRTAVLNIVMQLRKCCGHPYLFEGIEDRNLDPLGEHLVDNCGKLNMVDKLLKRLKERGSRVLIFTQMTRVLDILEDFMHMRGYEYCRIDGNTSYEDREESIDVFNKPNSSKFCFILSTRAGGLGINLQTADTCILYDSDWNPQQDLQAQDRCHRLGQKKPVNVYRLVSQNTIEEKIVERAQQKLKLDAMVVQQGRLKEKDKVSKEEIMAAVRFGADTVFRSEESTITDEDIDVILDRAAAKTKELQQKLSKAEKGDLLDFRLDGGISSQEFEGVDYSDKALRDHLRMLAANSIGKRERRAPPSTFNPIIHSKKSMVVNNQRVKLPRSLRLPAMEDHHFYNRERLLDLGKLEFETYATLRELGQLPSKEYIDKARTLLPPELAQEKLELLDEGYGTWTKSQYYHFVKAASKYGREDTAAIAADMDMREEVVAAYSAAFWKYGPTELKSEWERVVGSIEKGEKKIVKQKKLTGLLSKFVSTFENPREEMVFANKGTTPFCLEQDRALLCGVEKCGYGNWDAVRETIRNDHSLKFQHSLQGMTTLSITKRCDYRMRQMEKELEAREKVLKNQKPPNVIAAQKALDAIKEADQWDARALECEMRGQSRPPMSLLSDDAMQVELERLKDRRVCIDRLRDIEVQLTRCKVLAEETKQSIYRGDQYVNYSNIALRVTSSGVAKTQSAKAEADVEARINAEVLRCPECGRCSACTEKTVRRKLCKDRLEVRRRLMSATYKKLPSSEPEKAKKSTKKRKAEPFPTTKKPLPAAASAMTASAAAATAAVSAAAAAKKSPKLMMKKADGQLKPRITSNGNKRMAIPDDLFPLFCQRIGANGTGERVALINQFVEDHPTISIRQVTIKMSEITTRDRPPWISEPEKKQGRAFMFYLRPRYYKHLPEDERPEGWEAYAAEDDRKWEEEKLKTVSEKKKKEELMGSGMEDGSHDAGNDVMEASMPPKKKTKIW